MMRPPWIIFKRSNSSRFWYYLGQDHLKIREALNDDIVFVAITKDSDLSAWDEMFLKQED